MQGGSISPRKQVEPSAHAQTHGRQKSETKFRFSLKPKYFSSVSSRKKFFAAKLSRVIFCRKMIYVVAGNVADELRLETQHAGRLHFSAQTG